MGKRKRVSKSLEETERSMYKTFSSAANAVSLLYTQAQGQAKRAYYVGMQDAFERVLHWVENSNKPSAQINRQALTDFIQHELDAVESETPAPVTADQATLVHAKAPPAPLSQHRFVSHFSHPVSLSSPVRKSLLNNMAQQQQQIRRDNHNHKNSSSQQARGPHTGSGSEEAVDMQTSCNNNSNNVQLSQLGL